ncbi:MAG: hypothetical protein EA407_14935 [Rhodobacteraceae bacterium]|nr:MAG: hypothetical protein EA407_14935 [Paracoccaceae bacterium]
METPRCQSGKRLSPAEAKLLLLAARPSWSEEQKALADELVPQVTQWPVFIDTARRKFALPMVYENLVTLIDSPPPAEATAALRALSLRATAEILRRHAAFDWFHGTCVLPSGVAHAYFKGPALAAQFYPDPMQRFFRDVDILVPARQRMALMQIMLENGCKVFRKAPSGFEVLSFHSEADIRDYLYLTDVPSILTPQGLPLELHATLDHRTALFDSAGMLERACEVTLNQNRLSVLANSDHAVYLSYHHTRHLWSKLNWLADIAAVVTHPDIDLNTIRAQHSKTTRLGSTVAATLELHQLASTACHPEDFTNRTPGGDLLRVCVDGLHGDLELEREMKQGRQIHTVGFDWQRNAPAWRRYQLSLRGYLHLKYDDVRSIHGPRTFRYSWALALKLRRVAQRLIGRSVQR